MIICGFPGTGKSTMAKFSRWVDLESTPFEKDWERYAKVAKHMSNNGYTVMVSTHWELLAMFEKMEVPYIVIIPPAADKGIYMRRYAMRGNNCDFIKQLDTNWYRWLSEIIDKPTVLKTVIVLPKDGCIQAWAEQMRGE